MCTYLLYVQFRVGVGMPGSENESEYESDASPLKGKIPTIVVVSFLAALTKKIVNETSSY